MELTNSIKDKKSRSSVGFIDLFVVLGALFFYVVVGIFALILLKGNELFSFIKRKRKRSIKTKFRFSNSVILPPREAYN
jgi:hypothetical protein